jgi:hypothetical protein
MLGVGGLLCLALAGEARDARASVSLAETWDALLHDSSGVAVVTALDARGAWENGRIYTYTHLHVDRPVAGELAAGADVYVRTMGGIVGDVGQSVEGEAVFQTGASCLVFVHPGPSGAFHVTARGQGQFPVENNPDATAPRRLAHGPSLGALIRPAQAGSAPARLAAEVVSGRIVDDVAKDVVADWPRLHVKP